MSVTVPGSLLEYFADLTDPRVERTKLHQLLDVLVIAMCATICGAEGWEDFAEFGKAKQAWFETFLELPNGIPSPDTFRRVLARLDPHEFEACFLRWVQAVTTRLRVGRLLPLMVSSCAGRAMRFMLSERFIWSVHGPVRIA